MDKTYYSEVGTTHNTCGFYTRKYSGNRHYRRKLLYIKWKKICRKRRIRNRN